MNAQFSNGYALLIAVDENIVPKWSLPVVGKDVAALAQVFSHPERCAYSQDNVKVVSGKNATRQGILDGLAWLAARLAADSSGNATAVIYYSGHGWRDVSATPASYYLLPADFRENAPRLTALRAADFADAVEDLRPQRLLVILDCCHAAGMAVKGIEPGGAGNEGAATVAAGYVGSAIPAALFMGAGQAAAPEAVSKGFDLLTQGAGRAVLSSSQGEQLSYMRKDGAMSIFTYHLIEALTGHAQPVEGAGEVLVSDVMSHVTRRVPQSALHDYGQQQTPDFQNRGNFPIALLLGGKGVSKGTVAPDPLALASGGFTIGKIEAVNLAFGNQVIDQRGANIHVGDRTAIDTGGGVYVGGSVQTGGGDFVGRDKITVQQGIGGDELTRALAPVLQAVQQAHGDDATRAAAQQALAELQQELAAGKNADDSRIAGILDGLANLVPTAISTVVSAFGTPLLAGIAGPVTQFVLAQLRRRQG
jgi:hypothetical protein